ncbi:hypothetical protein BC830DRAFT_1170395 [Chytriomyces sp. MP71]|nr:hypothetical protein BC830DRAFT_1170395 [Chytriomyces sp. MP71]
MLRASLRCLSKAHATSAAVKGAAAASSAVPTTRELMDIVKAAHVRENNQRRVFALGLLIMAGMVSLMGYNTQLIRVDLNEHMRATDERITSLEDAIRKANLPRPK